MFYQQGLVKQDTHTHTHTHMHTTSSCDVNLPMGSIGFNKKGIQHMSPHENRWV